MFLIGLTGGIASGKTTVSSQFMHLGCPVIDADIIAREGKLILLVDPDSDVRLLDIASRATLRSFSIYGN